MKNTIYKYIFYEFLRYFLVALFAFATIVWTIQAVNFLDLVVEEGHGFRTYFIYSIFTLSKVLTKLIPFCFMLAMILTITKLEKDNEAIIMWTAGLNKIHIVKLIFKISLIIMLFQLFFTSVVNPSMLGLSRNVIKNSELQFVPTLMKEKQFNDSVEGLTIFIEEKIQSGKYKNLFIKDEGKIFSGQDSETTTIFAKYGSLGKDEASLVLYNGNIQKLNNDGDINVIKFEKTVLNFSNLSTKSIITPKIQETSTLKIFSCLLNINANDMHNCSREKKSLMDNKIELNKRFGMPIYIPLISLICAFLLASRKDKKVYYYNKYIYFFICFLILTLSEIFVRYSGTSWNYTSVYYLLPIGALPLFYFVLTRKFKYENLK
jgi:lipopolysaccharide export system permease protein